MYNIQRQSFETKFYTNQNFSGFDRLKKYYKVILLWLFYRYRVWNLARQNRQNILGKMYDIQRNRLKQNFTHQWCFDFTNQNFSGFDCLKESSLLLYNCYKRVSSVGFKNIVISNNRILLNLTCRGRVSLALVLPRVNKRIKVMWAFSSIARITLWGWPLPTYILAEKADGTYLSNHVIGEDTNKQSWLYIKVDLNVLRE